MRASLTTPRLLLQPLRPATAVVEVTNTSAVIDGIKVTAPRYEGLVVSSAPDVLALFPDSTGKLTVTLKAESCLPAGDHEVVLEVRSSVDAAATVTLILPIEVAPVPEASVSVDPPVRRARRKAQYQVTCRNEGNTVLGLELLAVDPARALSVDVEPDLLTVHPGDSATAAIRVRGRRHLFGAERRTRISVQAREGALERDASASFRQAPLISAGARTAGVLALIVGLWAAVLLVALHKATQGDALDKDVPASFYASLPPPGSAHTASFGAGPASGIVDASVPAGGYPVPGAIPKAPIVIGVGGTLTGAVNSASTSNGAGRITVEAFAVPAEGPDPVASAATAADGTFSIYGLMPGAYKLLFTAPGQFTDVWYPASPNQDQARAVDVGYDKSVPLDPVTITGLAAKITGTVDTGQTPPAPVTVQIESQSGGPAIAPVTTATGTFEIDNLPAPGTYTLSFSAAGYNPVTDVEEVVGGESHVANTVTLSAANGSLGGTVTDGTHPLGGVTITANANGRTVTTATPTTGAVGHFTIPNLATPATYLLTFSSPGYSTDTVAEHLGPGQSLTNVAVTLAGGAGQISGQVTSSAGGPVGGVMVTVDNAASAAATNTLTAGSVGSYLVSGLTTPGTYTLTFSLAGYQPQTISVPLGSSGSATGVNVTLPVLSGTIVGTVTSATGAPLSGVAVTVTDGTTVRSTATTSSPAGGFSLTGLNPSSYSVTFTLAGYLSQTVLVHLQPGQTATASTTLTPTSGAH